MGRLRFAQWVWIVVTISFFISLPACGGHTPPGVSRFPTRINLNPATSYSIQLGTSILFTASAQNAANGNISHLIHLHLEQSRNPRRRSQRLSLRWQLERSALHNLHARRHRRS